MHIKFYLCRGWATGWMGGKFEHGDRLDKAWRLTLPYRPQRLTLLTIIPETQHLTPLIHVNGWEYFSIDCALSRVEQKRCSGYRNLIRPGLCSHKMRKFMILCDVNTWHLLNRSSGIRPYQLTCNVLFLGFVFSRFQKFDIEHYTLTHMHGKIPIMS